MNYDIFISFKATDGCVPTQDEEIALALYNKLTDEGYNVFLAMKESARLEMRIFSVR